MHNKKQPILIFAPYNFLDFSLYSIALTKNIRKDHFWIFWWWGFSFFKRNFSHSEEFGTQKIGGGYNKFRLNGSEGFNNIFGVGMLKNVLAAKLKEIVFR